MWLPRPRSSRFGAWPARTISGAPSTQLPSSPKLIALHLRAEENGTRPATIHLVGESYATCNAREVAFELVDADPTLASHPDLLDEIEAFLDDDERDFLFKG